MICVACGNTFVPRNPKRPPKTCSRSCTNRMVWAAGRPANCGPVPAERPERACAHCGKPFVSRAHLARALNAVYCSRRCTGLAKSNGGWKWTDGRLAVRLRNAHKAQLYSRCLMEGHLKRHLTWDEIVHHINGDPTDDRIENLMVVSRAEHPTLHREDIRAGIRRARLLKAQKFDAQTVSGPQPSWTGAA
jgi:hypothetical protein